MNLEIIHVGLLGTNCYVTWDDNKNCVVVDCGGDAQKVADFINERGFTPTHLLLTHGHGDHMGGAADLKDLFPQIQIVLGEKDLEMIGDGEKSMSNAVAPYARPFVPDILVKDGDRIVSGSMTLHGDGDSRSHQGRRHLHQKQRALLRGHPVPGQHGPHRPVWGATMPKCSGPSSAWVRCRVITRFFRATAARPTSMTKSWPTPSCAGQSQWRKTAKVQKSLQLFVELFLHNMLLYQWRQLRCRLHFTRSKNSR